MEGTKGWRASVGGHDCQENIGAMACLAYTLSFLVQISRPTSKSQYRDCTAHDCVCVEENNV